MKNEELYEDEFFSNLVDERQLTMVLSHSVHWGINPLSKTPPPSFLLGSPPPPP